MATEKLVEAGKALDLALTAVFRHEEAKFREREQIHELRENGATDVHRHPWSVQESERI
jgi:hypothetical protein